MMESSNSLVVTRMDGPDGFSQTEHPNWVDIENAIRRLDGEDCSLLILGIGDPVPHMGIGGGEDGLYIVYTTTDNMIFYTLTNPQARSGKPLLVAGGQRGDYDNRVCVGLREVLLAAKTYALTGQNEATLVWKTT